MNYQGLLNALFILGIGALSGITISFRHNVHERIFKDGEIILGGMFPLHLTKNGMGSSSSCKVLRSRVLLLSEAMIYAVDEINRNGTFLHNVTLGYDIRDTCGNEQEGISIASDFVYENALKLDPRFSVTNSCREGVTKSKETTVVAVIGGLDSRVSVNVANVLQVQNVPQISYGASSAELAGAEFTSFFRTVPVDTFQSRAMAELIAHYRWTCVAVIGVDDWYGRSGVDAFATAANETGICIVLQELFPVHDSEAQVKTMISQLKNMEQVQIIILYSLSPQAIKVFEEAVRQGLTGKTWIASDGWSESALILQSRFKPIIQGAIGFGFHTHRFEEFEKHVTEMTPLLRRGSWWNEFWEMEFNCSIPNSTHTQFKPCSGQERVTPERYKRDYGYAGVAYVRDAVYSVANGLSGILNCGAQGRSCSESSSSPRPDDLLTSLKMVSFTGLTGYIDFRNGRVQAAYDIYNLQETEEDGFKLVQIGTWDERNAHAQRLSLRDDLVQWHRGIKPRTTCGDICPAGTYRSIPNQCFWECVPCDRDTVSESSGSTECKTCPEGFISNQNNTKCDEVPIEYIEWHEPWGVALSTLTAFCVLLTLVVLAIVLQYRKTPIMKETGGFLNVALLVVVLLSFIFNLIHLTKPSDLACRMLPPTFYVIYTGAALLQFLKVYRIRLLLKPLTTATHDMKLVYITVVSLWVLPVFLTLIWVISDPPRNEKYIISRLIIYGTCTPYQTNVGMALRYMGAIILSLILIGTLVVAYSTKRLPHNQRFDEAKHVAFSLTMFAITFATFYPGWSLIKGPGLTVFACKTNLVAATGTVLCIFGPKLWLIYRFPRHNTLAYVRPAPQLETKERSTTLLSIGQVAVRISDSPSASQGSSKTPQESPKKQRGSPKLQPGAPKTRKSSPILKTQEGSPKAQKESPNSHVKFK